MKKLGLMLMLLFTLTVLAACGGKTYTIDKELEVTFDGVDEHGTAHASLEKDVIFQKLKNQLKLKDEQKDFEKMYNLTMAIEGISVELDPNSDLKNGDAVKVSLNYDEKNAAKVKFKLKDNKVKVEGLKEITTLTEEEVFKAADITYNDISPFLHLDVRGDDSDIAQFVTFSIPDKNYAVGDEFEVKATIDGDPIQYGYKTDQKEMTTTMKVPEQEKRYVTKWEELKQEDRDYLLNEANDYVTAQVDAKLNDYLNLKNQDSTIAYADNVTKKSKSSLHELFFLMQKPTAQYVQETNKIHLLYIHPLTIGEGSFVKEQYVNKETPMYAMLSAGDLLVDKDGNLLKENVQFKVLKSFDANPHFLKEFANDKAKSNFTIETVELKKE